MGTETLMIGLSVAVLVSYWFSHLGRVLRFPSVVFLLIAGLVLREVSDARDARGPVSPERRRHPFDPDGSHMLVSETKPCKSKYTSRYGGNCERLIKSVTTHSAAFVLG